jgi:hypothetical protein
MCRSACHWRRRAPDIAPTSSRRYRRNDEPPLIRGGSRFGAFRGRGRPDDPCQHDGRWRPSPRSRGWSLHVHPRGSARAPASTREPTLRQTRDGMPLNGLAHMYRAMSCASGLGMGPNHSPGRHNTRNEHGACADRDIGRCRTRVPRPTRSRQCSAAGRCPPPADARPASPASRSRSTRRTGWWPQARMRRLDISPSIWRSAST